MRSIYLSLAISFSLIGLIPVGASAQGGLATRVAQLEAQVAALADLEAKVAALEVALVEVQAILEFVRVESESINGLAGPHWIVEGANVHVRSGSGSTHPCPDSQSVRKARVWETSWWDTTKRFLRRRVFATERTT